LPLQKRTALHQPPNGNRIAVTGLGEKKKKRTAGLAAFKLLITETKNSLDLGVGAVSVLNKKFMNIKCKGTAISDTNIRCE
jgi:hypothetical protein